MASVAQQYMILGLTVSILLNFVVLGAVFATGVGQRVLLRYRQRWLYKRGKHINTIFVRNNHVGREFFIKKADDGSFKIDGKPYVINPLATFIHDGIPTQINTEGNVEPLNLFDDKRAKDMTTAEIEKIIMNNEIHDLVAALKKYFPLVVVFVGIIIIFVMVSGYFNYNIWDALVQNDVVKLAIDMVKSEAVNQTAVPTR